MLIHPLCLLLVPALVTAAATPNCILGCKCKEEASPRKLQIWECDSPLILTKDALSVVSDKTNIVSFKNVDIQKIERDAFATFKELNLITIEDSSIGSIDPMAFYLVELSIVRFMKTRFGENPILNAEYVEELIFNDCQLSEVPSLDHLPALTFLNLENNFIKTINESAFNKVVNLEEVTLANNSITELPPNLFINNPDFSVLKLDNNPLTALNFNFQSALEILALKNCKLTAFDRTIAENHPLLTNLDLSANEISVLPIDAFEPLKELTSLDLSNNKLIELDDDIFLENGKLDKIIFDGNQFETLPKFKTNAKLFQTYTFSCKNCGLKSVKGAFDSMTALVRLDLSNNQLTDIDGVFTEMNGLKEIFLSNNQISTIGVGSFGTKAQLETLDLSNNPLSPLDPVFFTSVPSLKKLNISGSNLRSLWANHNAELPALEQLYVDKNQLSSITVQDVKIIPKLKVIGLQDNPLSCTQDLYDLISYLTKKSVRPKESAVRTHEELNTDTDLLYTPKHKWQAVLPPNCEIIDDDEDDDDEIDDEIDDSDSYTEEETENPDYEEYDEENQEDEGVEASSMNTGFNLARISYFLSITSVFILTALLVLFVAVVITLLILKRNKSFDVHNKVPRLKIPLWHTTPGQKKHSGSVYKPLSEELSGPRTPMINRYDFKQTPQVHNSLP